jgi:hypothetical protein
MLVQRATGPIELEEATTFLGPTGERAEVAPGPYHVSIGPDQSLALSSAMRQQTHHVQATPAWHELVIGEPRALCVAAPKGDLRVVMLLPGGAAFHASPMLNPPPPPGEPPMVTTEMLAEALVQQSPFWGMLEPEILTQAHSGTIEPAVGATPFGPHVIPPPTWVSCTVAYCQPCPDGSVFYPPDTPINRLPLADYMLSETPVTVQSTLPLAGRLVQLVVTSVVVSRSYSVSQNAYVWFPFMTWTDVYQQHASSNGALVFPSVIVATGRRTTSATLVHQAFSFSPSGPGAPTVFELRVNGITLAKRTCGFHGRYPRNPEMHCP